jgi:hypothetical protein
MKTVIRFMTTAIVAAAISSASCAATVTDIQIVDRTTGERLPTYKYGGQLWVAGKPGDRYAIYVSNKTGERMLTVVSVDGINVISGDTAAANQRGYVLSPRASVEIAGWRKSDRDVAAFYFTAVDDSYAGKTKRPDNVGVIGVAAFREYQEPVLVPAPVQEMASNAAAAPMRSRDAAAEPASPRAESKLGTGHGERVYSPTQQVDFKRASSTPDEIVTVRYDSYANLVARGIIPSPRHHTSPNAFPGSYVPDPS